MNATLHHTLPADEPLGRTAPLWPSLCRMKAEGKDIIPEVKAWILAEAEAGLIRAYGTAENRKNIDYLCALELACEKWFETHPLGVESAHLGRGDKSFFCAERGKDLPRHAAHSVKEGGR